jgi:hypothetical protein
MSSSIAFFKVTDLGLLISNHVYSGAMVSYVLLDCLVAAIECSACNHLFAA